MPAAAAPTLSDGELLELLDLLRGVDSAELKMTVETAGQRSAVAALGLDPLDAQIRMIYFFDTPELTLEQHGVVLRARRIAGRPDDSVVKLRPVVPDELPDRLRESPSFFVEVDAMPGGHVCSGSLKGSPRIGVREALAKGGPGIKKLFSKEQRAFFAAHAPEGVGFDDLSVLGPIFVLKLKGQPEGYNRKLVGELWLYPDMSRVLELSTKCAPSEAFQVAAETRAFLAARDIHGGEGQTTKTRKALSLFSARLADGES